MKVPESKIGEYPRWLHHPSKPPLKAHSEVDEAAAKEYRRAPYPPVEPVKEPTLEDRLADLGRRVTALENVPPGEPDPPKKAKKGD